VWKTGLPVRSAVLKPHAGELVVGWVTTSESSLLYVFAHPYFFDLFGNPLLLPCSSTPSARSPEQHYSATEYFFLFTFFLLLSLL
jgi:hypothetical protein